MQDLAPIGDWAMAAVLGQPEDVVNEICGKVNKGFVVPVNFNTTGQIVISGEKSAIEEADEIAKEMGVKRLRILKTSGPFHTEKLLKSSEALRKELENVKFNKFETEVVKNLDGTVYKNDDDMKEILSKHIISPVRFTKTLKTMVDMGVDTFIEIGPGKTLSGFVKRLETDKELKIFNINNVETLEQVIKEVI